MTSKIVASVITVNLVVVGGLFGTGCTSSPTYDEDRWVEEARQAKQQHQLGKARTLAEKALGDGRRQGEARQIMAGIHRQRAQQMLDEHNHRRAHSAFLTAAEYEPTTRRRAGDLGEALEAGIKAGLDDAELLQLAQRTLDDDPNNADLHRDAARLAEDLGDDDTAAVHYQWLFSADPTDTRVGLRLGIVYLNLERIRDAVGVLRHVYDAEPENIQAALNLATAYAQLERYSQAAELFDAMLDQAPNHPTILRNYAELEQQRGNLERARQLYQKASDASPGVDQREMRPLQ